jgi:hypothetical protein
LHRWILGVELPLSFTGASDHLGTRNGLRTLPADISCTSYTSGYRSWAFTKGNTLYESHLHGIGSYLWNLIE